MQAGESAGHWAAWWADTQQRADQPPARARQALRLAGVASPIGSVEQALGERLAGAGLPLVAEGGGWVVTSAPRMALQQIARWLQANGLSNGWRDEALDVMDADGAWRATVERAVVRPLGIATRAVHLIGLADQGGMWVQQRAFDKPTDPGLWDTTVGGLLAAGESAEHALARETAEEAGLDHDALRRLDASLSCVVRRPLPHGYMVEHIAVSVVVIPGARQPVNQDGEVAQFACLSEVELRRRLLAGDFTLEAAMALGIWLEARQRVNSPGPSAGSR